MYTLNGLLSVLSVSMEVVMRLGYSIIATE